MLRGLRLFLLALIVFATVAPKIVWAESFETSARQAIVVDANTGQVIYEKDADKRMPTASMSKVMTAYVVGEALAKGEITKDTPMLVSQNAWRPGADDSKMFVELGNHIPVWQLLPSA